MTYHINILVTDDEEGMRLGINRALTNLSCKSENFDSDVLIDVKVAASGEQCLDMLKTINFDLLLLDYKLPGINGIETLVKMKELYGKDAPVVIIMTAYASLQTAVTATKEGAFDFLAKPFTPKELKLSVRKAVKSIIYKKQAERLAHEKKQVRFEFISVLSHELKAPIGAVEGYLDLISKGYVKDEADVEKIINRCKIRLDGMRKLIFDILDLTRIESGAKKRNLKQINIKEIACDSIDMLKTAADQKNISISFFSPDRVELFADMTEIEIILNNLISNAVKYNVRDGSVAVELIDNGQEIKILVADTGIGLTEKEASKLFGEFVRIKNERTKNIEGSGLGLSTVRKIAQMYDGDVTVESKPLKGSRFTVVLKKGKEK